MPLNACSALHTSLNGKTALKGNFVETSLSVLLVGANWYAFRAVAGAAETLGCAEVQSRALGAGADFRHRHAMLVHWSGLIRHLFHHLLAVSMDLTRS